MKNNFRQKTAGLLLATMLAGQCSPAMVSMAAPPTGRSGDVVLVDSNLTAPIIVDGNSADLDGIQLNAEAFAGDIELVTGQKPQIYTAKVAGNEDSGAEGNQGSAQTANFALASNGAVLTAAGIHEDGIKKLSAVNDGDLAYTNDYWRGLNNGTASLTVEFTKKIHITQIGVIGRTDDGSAAAEETESIWANRKYTVSYKDDAGEYQTIKTVDKTGAGEKQLVWDKIIPETGVETKEIKVDFLEGCGQNPTDIGQDKGVQASVYVTELQVWGTEDGSGATDGTVEGLPEADTVIIAGTADDSLIHLLESNGKLNLDEIKDGYEQYKIQVVDQPFTGIGKAVVIIGSDKRGAIYGLYHISQDLAGVSPWYYWGDVPVETSSTLAFSRSELETISKEPSVKYRGIFLNDEAPSLSTWVKKFGGYNQDFYDNVYELILRLKGNYLWPAMWSNSFSTEGTEMIDGQIDTLANARHADAWGVIMGTSHHEPMNRAGIEWGRVWKDYGSSDAWNYNTNKEAISQFWHDGAERNKDFENIITIGMRGEADSPLVNPDGSKFTTAQQIQVLKDAINFQKSSLSSLELQDSPQMICLYKEVEDAWYGDDTTIGNSLKDWDVLNDDIIMLCEDNNGNLRTLPSEEEKANHKRWGMYYHFDYNGGPRTYMWVNTNPLAKVWDNMTMAYDYGVQDMWIVNVGDLKPMELPISYFLDMAYDYETWGTENPNSTDEYTAQWVEQQFGGSALSQDEKAGIVQILRDYPLMSSVRRPEVVMGDTFSAIHYNELQMRLAQAIDLESRSDYYLDKLKGTSFEDVYYQLVYYPAAATANVNKMQMFAGLNDLYYTRGSMAANSYAALVEDGIQRDKDLQDYYNNEMSGGKWNGMMLTPHVGYAAWNSSSGSYPTPKYLTPVDGSVMLVDVDGSESCMKEGDLELPEFTSTGMEAHALTISNGGNEKLNYTITADEWIQVASGDGSISTARTLPVTIDWTKITESKEGTITITAEGKTVSVKVRATVINTEGMENNTFTSSNGVIVANAADYTEKDPAWVALEALGKTGTTMKVFPSTAFYGAGAGPKISYQVLVPEDGEYNLTVYVGPSNNVYADSGVQYAVSVDNGSAEAINTIPDNYKAGDGNAWSNSILSAGRTATSKHTLNAGVHTITIYGMDAGLLLEKLVLSKSEIKKSHMGPSATWHVGQESKQQELVHYLLEESMTLPGTIYGTDYNNGGVSDAETEEGMLKTTAGTTYTYPVTISGSGSYQFSVTGRSASQVTVTLYCGGSEIGTVSLDEDKMAVTVDDAVELTQGTSEITFQTDGEALIEKIYVEKLNNEAGLPVTVIASSTAGDSSAEYAYDGKRSTAWSPTESDTEAFVGLDFGERIYTDWFRLNGSFDDVESYKIQMSSDGSSWTTIYEGSGAPESGKKVYVQGTNTCSGSQWRVQFTGGSNTLEVSELELNTYVNWALEDTETKVWMDAGVTNDIVSPDRYKETSLIDGDRISSKETGAWVAQDASASKNNNYAVVEFGKKRTLSAVNLVAMQPEVFKMDPTWGWDGTEGEIPDDTMLSEEYVQRSYTVSYRNEGNQWVPCGTLDTSAEPNKKVLTTLLLDEEITTDAIKVEVGTYYWILLTEIEPVQMKRYTLDGVKEGWKNWALKSNGGGISVSAGESGSTSKYENLNDGIRICSNGGENRWRTDQFPAWVEVSLSEMVTVDTVNLFGQQNAAAAIEPTKELAGLTYTPLKIQYWENDQWIDGTSIKSNKLVWNQWKPESPVTTDKIRVFVDSKVGDGWFRLCEVEVYGIAGDNENPGGEDKLTNYALSSNGGSAEAENTADGTLENVINGELANNNGRWRSKSGEQESSITITLDGEKKISIIDLITQLPDSEKINGVYSEPTLDSTTNLGIKNFDVYYKKATSSDAEPQWNLLETVGEEDTGAGTKVWNRLELNEPVTAEEFKFVFPKGSGIDTWVRVIEIMIWGEKPDEEVDDPFNLTVDGGIIESISGIEIGEAEFKAKEGDSIVVAAEADNADRTFREWKVKLAPEKFKLKTPSKPTIDFDMPAGDVTLKAEYDVKTATSSNATAVSKAVPAGWAYADQDDLDTLLEDSDIVTEADQAVLDDGGEVEVTMELTRKSGNSSISKAITESWSDEDIWQTAFLVQSDLMKKVAKKGGGKTTEKLTDASNTVMVNALLPDEWQSLPEDDYLLLSYTEEDGDYELESIPLEWLTKSQFRAELSANGRYAMLVPVLYTVTFKDYDGKVLKTENVKAGEDATPPAKVPSREGYLFIGWNKDYTNVTKNVTVTAKYSLISNEGKLVEKLERILDELGNIQGDGPIETEKEVKVLLNQVNAIDFTSYIKNEEVMDLLAEIEAAIADALGVEVPEAKLQSNRVEDADIQGALFGLKGEEGYLQISDTSVPSKKPSSAGKIKNAFALDVKLYDAKSKAQKVKGLIRFSFDLPETLELDDNLVVLYYPTATSQGEVFPYELSGGRMTLVTNQHGIFVIANKTEDGSGDYYHNSSGGGGGGGGAKRLVPTGQWKQNEKGWWYQEKDGSYPVNTWKAVRVGLEEIWYYFDAEGYMKTGWFTDVDHTVYYLNETKDGSEGKMITGWKLIGGKWYYFNTESDGKKGAMYVNRRTPDGNLVGTDGVWIKE